MGGCEALIGHAGQVELDGDGFAFDQLPTPPIWSNILAITGSSSLGSYVRHLATDTGAAGAAAVTARANGAPARQAPPKMDADFSHSGGCNSKACYSTSNSRQRIAPPWQMQFHCAFLGTIVRLESFRPASTTSRSGSFRRRAHPLPRGRGRHRRAPAQAPLAIRRHAEIGATEPPFQNLRRS